MDIFSHGLWGGITVGRQNKKSFWTALAFGIFPDALAFSVLLFPLAISLWSGGFMEIAREHNSGHPNMPGVTNDLYNISHSLIIFSAGFLLVWAIRKKPLLEMLAWGLHILMDMFTHSDEFFPTPFLWPISDYTVNGTPWSQPLIFFPNVALLVAFYVYWWYTHRKNRIAS